MQRVYNAGVAVLPWTCMDGGPCIYFQLLSQGHQSASAALADGLVESLDVFQSKEDSFVVFVQVQIPTLFLPWQS